QGTEADQLTALSRDFGDLELWVRAKRDRAIYRQPRRISGAKPRLSDYCRIRRSIRNSPMHSHSIENHRHSHIFLGTAHERNERKTWTVIAICAVMMVAEIAGGVWFGSVALVADGLHMSTHAGALLIAALAYTYSRRYATDRRLTFGTGKLGDLAAFASAIVLAMIALLIGYESVDRLIDPVPIAFDQAIPIAALGLGVNLLSAVLLRDDHEH